MLNRSSNLKYVQRFLAGWLAVFSLAFLTQFWQIGDLDKHYLVERPTGGGVYVEGVVGEIPILNPLFSDTHASRLIFSGLAKRNYLGQIEPDLAEGWQASQGGTVYTVKLRPNLKWHDGASLTAKDVAFTINLAQNTATRSPLYTSWEGVKVRAVDDLTVEFSLPAPFAPFPSLLTVGLLPRHVLGNVEPAGLRVSNFNTAPVGSGPYQFKQSIATTELRLTAFSDYVHGSPNIVNLIIKSYGDYGQLASAFKSREVSGMGGFSPADTAQFTNQSKAVFKYWPTSSQAFLFMNTARAPLDERPLRQAINAAIDGQQLAATYPDSLKLARLPLLPEQLGYDDSLAPAAPNSSQAEELLAKAGWRSGDDNTLKRRGKTLSLKLVAPSEDIYPLIASQLQSQLARIGIDTKLVLEDYETLQTDYIKRRDYDLLLFSISLGADPDSYSYWHSSQTGPEGFNLSNYRSSAADEALEAGRTRLDDTVRAAKYRTFLKVWRRDLPAVALYRQTYPYIYRGLTDFNVTRLVEPLDRFAQAHTWTVKSEQVLKRLAE